MEIAFQLRVEFDARFHHKAGDARLAALTGANHSAYRPTFIILKDQARMQFHRPLQHALFFRGKFAEPVSDFSVTKSHVYHLAYSWTEVLPELLPLGRVVWKVIPIRRYFQCAHFMFYLLNYSRRLDGVTET